MHASIASLPTSRAVEFGNRSLSGRGVPLISPSDPRAPRWSRFLERPARGEPEKVPLDDRGDEDPIPPEDKCVGEPAGSGRSIAIPRQVSGRPAWLHQAAPLPGRWNTPRGGFPFDALFRADSLCGSARLRSVCGGFDRLGFKTPPDTLDGGRFYLHRPLGSSRSDSLPGDRPGDRPYLDALPVAPAAWKTMSAPWRICCRAFAFPVTGSENEPA